MQGIKLRFKINSTKKEFLILLPEFIFAHLVFLCERTGLLFYTFARLLCNFRIPYFVSAAMIFLKIFQPFL